MLNILETRPGCSTSLKPFRTNLLHEEFKSVTPCRVVRLLEPSRGTSDKQVKRNPGARCFHTGSDGSDLTHAQSFTSTILYTKRGGVLMRTHLQSAQHVIPSHSGKYHTGYGHIIRTLCEYLCSHKDILYGSMQVMSRLLHVYKPQSFRSKYTVSSPQNN